MTNAKLVKLFPSGFTVKNDSGENAFLLSNQEWSYIQLYVFEGIGIPGEEAALKKYLFGDFRAENDLSDFQSLLQAFSEIRNNCRQFYDHTFPESIKLAGDIHDYGINKTKVFYPAISQVISAIEDNPDNSHLRKRLKALVKELADEAGEREAKAKEVIDKIQDFENRTDNSRLVLSGKDGNGGIAKELQKKYGTQSDKTQELKAQIKGLRKKVEDLGSKIEDYKTAQWAAGFGAILLGPCGAAVFIAAEAGTAIGLQVSIANFKDQQAALQKSIDELDDREQLSINLFNCINYAQTRVDKIVTNIKNALPYIQKIHRIWVKIKEDLEDILTKIDLIQTDVEFLKQFALDDAVAAWEEVAKLAHQYRINARIKIIPVDEIKSA